MTSQVTYQILPILALKDNYVWAMVDMQHQTVLIVDPGEAAPVLNFLKQKSLKPHGILITHHHWDHTNGIEEIAQHYSLPIVGPINENISGVTLAVKEGDDIAIANFSFKVMGISGHTLGHVAYYTPDILFCGDTLFAAGCGRIFEGTAEQMYASLQKMAALPNDTKIYCAHEYTLKNLQFAEIVEPDNAAIAKRIVEVKKLREQHLPSLPSILKDEKATNPFLRCHSSEVIASVEKFAGKKLSSPVKVFAYLRKWKDEF